MADGFVGNIVLKTIEGTARFLVSVIRQEARRNLFAKLSALAALPILGSFRKRIDPRRYNGAIFLGLRGIVVKSHGGTDAAGFAYALEEAYHEAQADSIAKIEQGIVQKLAQEPSAA